MRIKSPSSFLWVSLALFALVACTGGPTVAFTPPPTQTSVPSTPTQPDSTSTQPPEPSPTQDLLSSPGETLETLKNIIVPENDLYEIAARFLGLVDVPRVVSEAPPPLLRVGAQNTFQVSNNDTNESFTVNATLRYVTDHVYFWIEDGVGYEQGDLADLVETFENEIYPTNREFFGSEWSPGVDGDPHIYILYVRDVGATVAGYFSSIDSINPVVRSDSNGHETFVLSADMGPFALGNPFTYAVLAHEFQHMIHWNLDRNESSWINEGFSEVAQLLNGFTTFFNDRSYLSNPDLQLNDWPNGESTAPYYGSSFLFLAYYLDRFGDEATQALVASPENGLESVDLVLAELGEPDPLTGNPVTADDLVLDWAVTNYLNDPGVGDGRFAYVRYENLPSVRATENVNECAQKLRERTVHQYGVDYIRIACPGGPTTLHLEAAATTRLLPADPYSGLYAFWSNKGDESDMTLTREFDFTGVEGPLTLSFWTWYDIEKDWDYVYLLASVDGQNWDFISTPSGTDANPIGNNYGFGYTGLSTSRRNWKEEMVDISQYAEQVVQLRFEYITDAAVNGEGMLIDDVYIPEIDYFADFETDDGGWVADGFARVQNILPQTFRLALVSFGGSVTVEYLTLNDDNTLDVPLDFSGGVTEYVLVVVGTTRFTRSLASYSYDFLP